MFRKCLYLLGVFCVAAAAPGDTLELKDKATVTGKILSEKRDQIAIDIGYTVLVVPRSQIVKITKVETPARNAKTTVAAKAVEPEAQNPAVEPGFYINSQKGLPASSVRDLVNMVGEAVVQIRTPSGLGSGFIINEDGFLLTNFHVIEGETQISVEVYHQAGEELQRKTYKQVRIVAMNKFADLALLKIEEKDAPKFKFVVFGNADIMAVGEGVFAVGSPLGLERTVTEGILSTKTREMQGELYLQTTAQINPGNSGGPLFNLAGEVVGVINMKATYGEGLGFAIPVSMVKFFLDHRDAFLYLNDNPGTPYRYLEPPTRTKHATIAP